ncbi:MAG: STAS domain-containing protein [Solirubrobacteraceae bacterium]
MRRCARTEEIDLSPHFKFGPALADSLRRPGPIHLEVLEEHHVGETVLRALGEVDLMTAPRLAAHLDSVVRRGHDDVVMDLTGTEFLDSAGLYVLLNAQRRLARRSRRLKVICGRGPVRQVIELARLVETLNVADPEQAPPQATENPPHHAQTPSPTRR